MKKNNILYVALGSMLLFSWGCKKSYLETVPTASVTDDNLFTTTTGCRSVLDGMARIMTTYSAALTLDGNPATNIANDFGQKEADLAEDVSGGDVVCAAGNFDWFSNFYKYATIGTATYRDPAVNWYFYYKLINASNLLIANVDKATGNQEDIDDIKGEAYAYRAWCYYKLSIYYCKTYSRGINNPGVPIYTTPTTSATVGQPRGTVGDVYKRIAIDIDSAVALIAKGGKSQSNKTYISLATAYGIYAEISLVKQDWANAEKYSDLSITTWGGASNLMDSATYRAGFAASANPEFMWTSKLTQAQMNADEMIINNFFSFVDNSYSNGYAGGGGTWRAIPTYLYNQIAASDVRKTTFDANKRNHKFYIGNNTVNQWDNLYMRIAEMYLIKAEAQAQQSNEAGAITTLEILIKKRNPNYSYATTPYFTGAVPVGPLPSTKLLEEIYLQRRIELWLEGKSFSDMLRLQKPLNRPTGTGNFSTVTAVVVNQGSNPAIPANDARFLYKIPQKELDTNPNINPEDQN